MITRSSSTLRALHRTVRDVACDIYPSSASCLVIDRNARHTHSSQCKEKLRVDSSSRQYSTRAATPITPLARKKLRTVKDKRDPSSHLKLLEPHVLAERIKKLADENRLDDAIEMVQNAPQDACNVTVWSTLIWNTLVAKRYNLGYKLYIDMKRRGYVPNTRTYTTMLDGLSRIENLSAFSVQLRNAHSVYESFMKYVAVLIKHYPGDKNISPEPVAFYIRILGLIGDYNKMFDVFNALDEDGPFAPNEFIYAKMFKAIADRKKLSTGDEGVVRYRNASDAKLLWNRLVKSSVRRPELISPWVVVGCLKVLSQGRPTDQLFAFDIIRDHLGLAKPGEFAPRAKFELTSQCLEAVLSLCIHTQNHGLCIHYYHQAVKQFANNPKNSPIDIYHVTKVLRSYAHMAITGSWSESSQVADIIEWIHDPVRAGHSPERSRPKPYTYALALTSCWRGGDWKSTVKIMQFMSGHPASAFTDENQDKQLRLIRGKLTPSSREMACIVRAAHASGNLHNMRQALRMLLLFGEFKDGRWTGFSGPVKSQLVQEKNHEAFYDAKLVSSLKNMLDLVLADIDASGITYNKADIWRAIRASVRQMPPTKLATPDLEEDLLGSIGLAQVADFVEYDMTKSLTE